VWATLIAAPGCHAARQPPKLTVEQRRQVETVRLPYRIAVDTHRLVTTHLRGTPLVVAWKDTIAAPAYSNGLIRSLRRTGMFLEVDYAHNLTSPPDLFAETARGVSGCAVIPVWTALTLGVIPTVCQERYGEVFNLRRVRDGDSVRVSYVGQGPAVLGWVAVLLNPFPGWSMKSVRMTSRFDQQVAASVAGNAEAIRRLVEGR
jgi:hypothetical protein